MKKLRNGQVAIYLIMILVVIFMFAILNVDSFLAVRGKNRVQNAGDAAALAASRRQGTLLNEIGRLNIEHLLAVIANDSEKCDEIVREQRRLALLGPIDALRDANEAAKKNGMPTRDEFRKILRDHVATIRLVYSGGENASGEPYPEPFPGAWTDYATAIENVIAEGLATGPDNIEFYDELKGHLLLNHEFYQAIAARDWCWFLWTGKEILTSYNSYRDWGPLPVTRENPFDNSEIFSLHINSRKSAASHIFSRDEIRELAKRFANREIEDEEFEKSILLSDKEQVWFFFDDYAWKQWFSGLSLADDEDAYQFPLIGEIKEEYNIRGCAAICRCVDSVESFALDEESDLTWAAGAKPFGTLEDFSGDIADVTKLNKFVVPVFNDVRLVAIDSVGGKNLATADYGWITHIRKHLANYLQNGPSIASGCYYCLQLKTWENPIFRKNGDTWLKYNSGLCVRPTGGGGHGGGTSHGH